MPLAQHKHHRDARSPGANLRPERLLTRTHALPAWDAHSSLGSSPCSRSGVYFFILHKPLRVAAGQAHCHSCRGQGGDGSSAYSTEGRQQTTLCNPANRAHLLLKLTLACLFSPGANAISPRSESRAFCGDLSTYGPVGCPPRSRVCSPPKVGAPPL